MKPVFRPHGREDVLVKYKYDHETGFFTHKSTGLRAGTTRPSGYRQIYLCGSSVMEHRVAWLVIYGVWPEHYVDHINFDKSDNRKENLREATPAQNRHHASKRRGCYLMKDTYRSKPWRAMIRPHGHPGWIIGYFATEAEAVDAFDRAAVEHYGEFAPIHSRVGV